MGSALPRLRLSLDIMPSPVVKRPGLLLRDPFRYTEDILIIPPLLAAGLALFDGEQTDLDLQVLFSRLTGEIVPMDIVDSLISALGDHGFLETAEFETRRSRRHSDFARAESRLPAHAGSGYSEPEEKLRGQIDAFISRTDLPVASTLEPGARRVIGVAAPHVSPDGGWQSYAAAYKGLSRRIGKEADELTIVVLGTSHYGAPERFGLTRKPFVTPLGTIDVDTAKVDWLESHAADAIVMEDYCHSIEHSIEFQCIFLQHALGTGFKILPILCGPFAEATLTGAPPEQNESVKRFLGALSSLHEKHEDGLFWVLGVDLAHVGRRYGDPTVARANEGEMLAVAKRDKTRIDRVCAGDAEAFLNLVVEDGDPLRWCGFSPIYTFLRAIDDTHGRTIRYDQWNIDKESMVSFAALEFYAGKSL